MLKSGGAIADDVTWLLRLQSSLYMYGPDAHIIWVILTPCLSSEVEYLLFFLN